MTQQTRRTVLKTTGLVLCSALFGELALAQDAAQDTATETRLAPPPIAPGESRASRVEWYLKNGVSSPGRAILASYGDIYGLPAAVALRIVGGLSGGIGHTGEACGTVLAGVMLLSLKHESANPADKATHAKMVALGKQFKEDWLAKYKSVSCRTLIQCDISTPELYADAAKNNAKAFDVCYAGGKYVVELLENKYDILNR